MTNGKYYISQVRCMEPLQYILYSGSVCTNIVSNAVLIRAYGLFTTDPVAVNNNASNDVCVNAIL